MGQPQYPVGRTEVAGPMRIGFDVSQTGAGKAGCGYLADGLIRELAALDHSNEYLLYPAVGDVYWDPECSTSTFRSPNANFRSLPAFEDFETSKRFWQAPPPDFEHRLGEPDIFHSNNYFCPAGLTRSRLVYTLYDMVVVEHPELCTEANRLGCFTSLFRAGIRADFIVAISEFTGRNFQEVFPHYPQDRIRVVYPGSRFSSEVETRRPAGLSNLEPEGFWLSVATLEPRKNHRLLLGAYAMVKCAGLTAMPLVLAGGQGWLMENFHREIHEFNLESDVILTGYVADDELQWLYANCFAFVFPSLFEGFGLPVLEALTLGAPVICSNRTSLPEIAGGAAVLIDPLWAEDLAAAMHKLESGEIARSTLLAAGREKARMFSWRCCAQQILAIYEEVLGRPKYADPAAKL
jgi:glycosyltransferase involved in cell wall biosynthesis